MSLIEPGEGVRKRRAEPELVLVGNRWVISSGQFHLPRMADYILPRSLPRKHHPKGSWISIAEIAGLKGTGADLTAKKKARAVVPRFAAHLLEEHSRVLIYEYDGRRIARVKVFDPESASEDERQEAMHKLNQMQARRDLSAERYEAACVIVLGPTTAPSESI